VRESVGDMLVDLGHAIVAVGSAREALDVLASDDRFDLVLTDLAMPGMTGAELAEALPPRLSHLPVQLMTGFGEATARFPRLAKPFDGAQLSRALADALRRV